MPKIGMDRLCAMNCHYIRYSFGYFLDAAALLGYSNIELWAAAPHYYIPDKTLAGVDAVRREINRRGLRLICVTPEQVTYPYNIAAQEERLRTRSVDYYIEALLQTQQLGCGLMLLTPGVGYNDEPRADAWNRAVDSISRIAAKAERLGVILALEHLTPASSNLINTAGDLAAMLRAVPSPNLCAMLDTVQAGVIGERAQQYLDALGKRLAHLHFVDGTPGGHLTPGDGTLPLRREFNAIAASGYTGYLSLEIADRRYFSDPMNADRHALRLLRGWMG